MGWGARSLFSQRRQPPISMVLRAWRNCIVLCHGQYSAIGNGDAMFDACARLRCSMYGRTLKIFRKSWELIYDIDICVLICKKIIGANLSTCWRESYLSIFERARRCKWRAIAVNWVQQGCSAHVTRHWIVNAFETAALVRILYSSTRVVFKTEGIWIHQTVVLIVVIFIS